MNAFDRILFCAMLTMITVIAIMIDFNMFADTALSPDSLEYLQDSQEYMYRHDKCFTDYNLCISFSDATEEQCWTAHENCVIDNYKEWMLLKDKKGY